MVQLEQMFRAFLRVSTLQISTRHDQDVLEIPLLISCFHQKNLLIYYTLKNSERYNFSFRIEPAKLNQEIEIKSSDS